MVCSGKSSCKCKHCTGDADTIPYSANAVATRAQKQTANELVPALTAMSAVQLQYKQQQMYGAIIIPVSDDDGRSKAVAAARIALDQATGYKRIPGSMSNKSVDMAKALLGVDNGADVATTRILLSKVAEAAAAKGPLYVPNSDMTPQEVGGAQRDMAILQSELQTQASRGQTCDQYSVYNPSAQRYAPADVEAKRLACANETNGMCAPVSGGSLYPFACAPTFEQCIAGNAAACSIISKQVGSGVDIEAIKKLHGATVPNITAKPGDALEVLNALDRMWGYKSSLTKEGHETEYDILVVAQLMDTAELKDKQSGHDGPGTFDMKNRLLVDKVWAAVEVPLIKTINRARGNPATFNDSIAGLLDADDAYRWALKLTPAQLQKQVLDLADSTDLMAKWLFLNGYVIEGVVKISKWDQIALVIGIYLMKRFLFGGISGSAYAS